MQSEPTAVFDRSLSVDPSLDVPFNSTQHGNDSHGEHPVSGLRHQKSGDSSVGHDSCDGGQQSPLKEADPAPFNDTVSQYEHTVAPLIQKEEGVKSRKKQPSIYSGLSLEAFPNGMSSRYLGL